jgi:hypothetical protein
LRGIRTAFALLAVTALAGVASGEAAACVCANEPIEDRLDGADAAVVGDVLTIDDPGGATSQPFRILRLDVTQRVKGDVHGERVGSADRVIFVRVPKGTDCDLPEGVVGSTTGLLMTSLPAGGWYATACSLVAPGLLVAAGGEPRGGPIKVAIGIVILGLVLLWALRRLRKGTRPDLPGAPRP